MGGAGLYFQAYDPYEDVLKFGLKCRKVFRLSVYLWPRVVRPSVGLPRNNLVNRNNSTREKWLAPLVKPRRGQRPGREGE